jgi:hypothetical protein
MTGLPGGWPVVTLPPCRGSTSVSAPERRLPWTRPGTNSRTREAAAPKRPRSTAWETLHLDDLTKILALSGGLIYGVIFMAYRAYYDALNLSPEDVGVDPTYILVRSPGFILLTILAVLFTFLFLFLPYLSDRAGAKFGIIGRIAASLTAAALFMGCVATYTIQIVGPTDNP